MRRIIFLFLLSIVLTAVFSYSLNVFLKLDIISLTLKTMLIPCFTWSILLLLAIFTLPKEKRINYGFIAGAVCAWGSAVLVPGGIYNFISASPDIRWSVASVICCVVLMSALFFIMLKKNGFGLCWWWAFNILICVNMTLFYLSATV